MTEAPTAAAMARRGSTSTATVRAQAGPSDVDHRWWALAFIALAQLMVALDATVVNIALPSAQAALQFSDAQRQWVITAYTLAFGGLLLLGGRLSDAIGRRTALLIGLAGFALASAASGAAPNLAILIAARAAQGAFAALLAPTALSLLAVMFTLPRDRARAFGVYGAIAGSGGAVGLVLGGLLTQYLGWRWCLYVNVPVAIVAALGVRRLLPATAPGKPNNLDLPGAALATTGLVALVGACTAAVGQGWLSLPVLTLLLVAISALILFVVRESRIASPLLPLRIVRDRNRAGAYLSASCAIVGMFGAFLLLSYALQVVLHYTPLQAGLAFLPLSAAAMFGSAVIATRLLPRVPARALMAPGFVAATAGMLLLTRLQADSAYLAQILPAQLLLGLGVGCVMVPASSVATAGVDPREAGVASAVLNTAQQVGASLGTALLNTLATTATLAFAAAAPTATSADALVHGYTVAALGGAVVLACGAVLAAVLVTAHPPSRVPTPARSSA